MNKPAHEPSAATPGSPNPPPATLDEPPVASAPVAPAPAAPPGPPEKHPAAHHGPAPAQHAHVPARHAPAHHAPAAPRETAVLTGTLEITDKGTAFLRTAARNYAIQAHDPSISQALVAKYRLRCGVTLECLAHRHHPPRPAEIVDIQRIMGRAPQDWINLPVFEDLQVIDPQTRLKFETPSGPTSMRVVDLMTPIGRGQRGLIVAPPRTGKTVLLQQMAAGIAANHPDIYMMVLLVDERPEEVTEMRRSVHGEVVASSNDQDIKSHVRLTRLMSEKAKRHVENGEHILVLLDSLTRLGRAFNNFVGSSGRTMTGGLDIKAMEEPKRMFGAARNIEGGGSLTILASALIDTGSRMDEYIFQEFKGTGNMEIVLDREMANRRVFPAIDLEQSGTRKEELLLGHIYAERVGKHIRRKLLDMKSNIERMDALLKMISLHKTNSNLLDSLPK